MPSAIKFSHLDKVLFPKDAITKGELIEYYRSVAERMLPHLQDRPLAMARYPNGIDKPSFFQQAAPTHLPSWVKQVTVSKEDGEISHVLCQDEQTLAFLANQAAVTLHTWLSRVDRPERPDQLLFDLDPPHEFEEARHAALALRELLTELGLPCVVKTTGGRGLHVGVPIERRYDADELREFARDICAILESREPDRYTSEVRKAKRGDRLFLDVSRNAYAQLVVAPYTVRATPDARVATPLDWSEVEDETLTPSRFTLRSMGGRTAESDPWHVMPEPATSLTSARRRVDSLLAA
ncbi:non-homologous end-joining DNA ligase [Actinospica durhamensis]|uniref:Non-homologous end-joining DNA ligase n=1 Tax=Actinospica durhamensis TaxID=1508375 RepID=A0A941EVG0_9ACTN|nr:non-homologous end-joining DNA ligase [Actinospica durhamensis]MBR7837168.1 non-homologous end-joining DNA ligase [Actinospica durhamensis]